VITPEEREELRKASEASAQKARALLDEDLRLVMDQVQRINDLKPKTTDEETYEKLIAVVRDATAKNESLATLKQNVQQLGSSAVALLTEMAGIARKL